MKIYCAWCARYMGNTGETTPASYTVCLNCYRKLMAASQVGDYKDIKNTELLYTGVKVK